MITSFQCTQCLISFRVPIYRRLKRINFFKFLMHTTTLKNQIFIEYSGHFIECTVHLAQKYPEYFQT